MLLPKSPVTAARLPPATAAVDTAASVCRRCARRIARLELREYYQGQPKPLQPRQWQQKNLAQQPNGLLFAATGHPATSQRQSDLHQQQRSYRTASRSRTAAIAGPGIYDETDRLDRRFFWANAFHGQAALAGAGAAEAQTFSETGQGGKDGVKMAEYVEDTAATTSNDTARSAVAETEELPHRRRKRLKAEAAAAAAAAVGTGGTNGQGGVQKMDAATLPAEQPLPLDASSQLSQEAAAAPARSFRRVFSTYLALTKPRLAFLIVLTTTAAYSVYPVPALLSTSATAAPSLSTLTLAFLTTGTFLAIASANTLNMLFEPQFDAKMSRTRNRPLVRGLVSPRAAALFAAATGAAGTLLLWYGVNPTTSLLGAANIVLYAFIYTPLKRIHPVNTWVGALVGAIPPLMGWCAAGSQYSPSGAAGGGAGSDVLAEAADLLLTPAATGGWLLAALLFAWQFPHFFALAHAVRAEYAGAGYRMLVSTNIPMAARVSLRYSLVMFPICFALPAAGVVDPAFAVLSAVPNAWMVKEAWAFWRLNGEKGSARRLFWASVWQLPIVLVLAMVFKKGLWERVWRGVFGEEDDGVLLLEEYEDEDD